MRIKSGDFNLPTIQRQHFICLCECEIVWMCYSDDDAFVRTPAVKVCYNAREERKRKKDWNWNERTEEWNGACFWIQHIFGIYHAGLNISLFSSFRWMWYILFPLPFFLLKCICLESATFDYCTRHLFMVTICCCYSVIAVHRSAF